MAAAKVQIVSSPTRTSPCEKLSHWVKGWGGYYVMCAVIASVDGSAVHYDVCTHLHCSLRCECLRTTVRGAWSIMVAVLIGNIVAVGEDLHLNCWS